MDDKECSPGAANPAEQSRQSMDGLCISVPLANLDAADGGVVAKMVTHRYDPLYKMNHRRRGLALIFGHEHFDDPELERRTETDMDIANLQRVLGQLDFSVKVYKDLTSKDVKRKIRKAANANHDDHDCILVAVLTHGDCDLVYAKDLNYMLDDLWAPFTADQCTSLAGKPKIFIVEANQGKRRDPGYTITETDGDSGSNYKIPIFADFLVTYSTIPDYCSLSDPEHGSWFIKSLCLELEANGRHLDLLMLLTFVAQRVAVDFETIDEGHKQITCSMSTLTRILRFTDFKRSSCP